MTSHLWVVRCQQNGVTHAGEESTKISTRACLSGSYSPPGDLLRREIIKTFTFPRHGILELTDIVSQRLDRRATLPAVSKHCFDVGHALFPPNLSMTVCVCVCVCLCVCVRVRVWLSFVTHYNDHNYLYCLPQVSLSWWVPIGKHPHKNSLFFNPLYPHTHSSLQCLQSASPNAYLSHVEFNWHLSKWQSIFSKSFTVSLLSHCLLCECLIVLFSYCHKH